MPGLPIDLNGWMVPPLAGSVIFFSLAALAMVRGRGRRVNLLFSAICVLGGFSGIDKAFSAVLTDGNLALQISRLDHLIFVLVLPVYLHFTCSFLQLRKQKRLMVPAYLFSACLSLLSQRNDYLSGTKKVFFGYCATGGPLLFVFGAAAAITTLCCVYLLIRSLKQENDPDFRNRTKYVLVGLGMAAFMAQVDLFALAGAGVYPASGLVLVPIPFLGFAVLKSDLPGLGIVIQKGLIYSLLTALITGAYALCMVLFNQVFKGTGHGKSAVFSILFFSALVLIFEPLRKKVQKMIRGRLFKGRCDYQKTLMVLGHTMASMLNLNDIMDKIPSALTHGMGLAWGCVMLMDKEKLRYRGCSHRGAPLQTSEVYLDKGSPLVREMEQRKQAVSRNHLESWATSCSQAWHLKKDFRRLGGALIVPMLFKGRLNGLLVLGNKKSGDIFTRQDMDLLRALAGQCAVSIENAKAYAVVKKINANLEKLVQDRTGQLQAALRDRGVAKETGPGFYVPHEMVRQHDGKITAEKGPQGRALFGVELTAR